MNETNTEIPGVRYMNMLGMDGMDVYGVMQVMEDPSFMRVEASEEQRRRRRVSSISFSRAYSYVDRSIDEGGSLNAP